MVKKILYSFIGSLCSIGGIIGIILSNAFSEILIFGFYLTLAGWILTVLEGFFIKDFLNLVEHACYAGSSLSVAFWCFKVFDRGREGS